MALFEKEMLDGLCGEYSFVDVVGKARMRSKGTFTGGAKEAMVEEDAISGTGSRSLGRWRR